LLSLTPMLFVATTGAVLQLNANSLELEDCFSLQGIMPLSCWLRFNVLSEIMHARYELHYCCRWRWVKLTDDGDVQSRWTETEGTSKNLFQERMGWLFTGNPPQSYGTLPAVWAHTVLYLPPDTGERAPT